MFKQKVSLQECIQLFQTVFLISEWSILIQKNIFTIKLFFFYVRSFYRHLYQKHWRGQGVPISVRNYVINALLVIFLYVLSQNWYPIFLIM